MNLTLPRQIFWKVAKVIISQNSSRQRFGRGLQLQHCFVEFQFWPFLLFPSGIEPPELVAEIKSRKRFHFQERCARHIFLSNSVVRGISAFMRGQFMRKISLQRRDKDKDRGALRPELWYKTAQFMRSREFERYLHCASLITNSAALLEIFAPTLNFTSDRRTISGF